MRIVVAVLSFAGIATPTIQAQPATQASSQQQEKPVKFEAASVKPTSPNLRNGAMVFGMLDPIGGPGSDDPGRIRYPVISLKSIFVDAFRVRDFQIEGPDWLEAQWFEIEATMPPETTREQLSLMLQNLLSDRFGLAFHRETKQVSGYSLVVGKYGPKFKEPVKVRNPQGTEGPINWGAGSMGADGFTSLPSQLAGRTGLWFFKGLRGNRVVFQQQTMQTLAGTLSTTLGRPVVDATALPAKYDFTLIYTPDDFQMGQQTERFPRIFDAVQSFGLKLEPTKLPAAAIVIDHLEKTPTDN